MPHLLSEDFVRNRLGRLMAGRDERFFRDSKLTGFLLRVRRAAEGSTFLPTWFIEQPVPGKKNPRKVIIGDYPTFPADKAREQAQSMLQAVKRGDDPAAERARRRRADVGGLGCRLSWQVPAEEEAFDPQALQRRDRPNPDACL